MYLYKLNMEPRTPDPSYRMRLIDGYDGYDNYQESTNLNHILTQRELEELEQIEMLQIEQMELDQIDQMQIKQMELEHIKEVNKANELIEINKSILESKKESIKELVEKINLIKTRIGLDKFDNLDRKINEYLNTIEPYVIIDDDLSEFIGWLCTKTVFSRFGFESMLKEIFKKN